MISKKIFYNSLIWNKTSYLLIILFFFIDILSASILKVYLIESLFSYLVAVSIDKTNKLKSAFIVSLLLIKSFMNYGYFALNLGPILLIIYIISKSKNFFSNLYLSCAIYSLLYLILQIVKQTLLLFPLFLLYPFCQFYEYNFHVHQE